MMTDRQQTEGKPRELQSVYIDPADAGAHLFVTDGKWATYMLVGNIKRHDGDGRILYHPDSAYQSALDRAEKAEREKQTVIEDRNYGVKVRQHLESQLSEANETIEKLRHELEKAGK